MKTASYGFSILEVLVCCLVLGIVGQWTVSSIAEQLAQQKIKAAAAQVHGLLTSASDSAYGMKKDLWLHTASSNSQQLFALHTDSSERNSESLFNGAIHPQTLAGTFISTTFSTLRFSGVTGRPYGNGNISIGLNDEPRVKVIFHDITGRMRICAIEERAYGYPAC
ncbi:hypothetical protein [Vibrio sp. B1Z05]|uniref:hypothetical protein n=1 Tax=Vibrio sp. B1Z05 TaxID=2654980 RepID=UPI00128E2B22|nr:hypothetical protein [Vibrio sp. B1Z05]MPW35116.1 hypothetical protein [Vibrio sp. B1Z05]